MTKLLIVRLGALGDIVHALPVAAAIRGQVPEARIDWLVDARYAGILRLVPVIDRVLVVGSGRQRTAGEADPRERRFAGFGGLLRVVVAMRGERYDVALDLQGLLKSACLARLSGARRVVGFTRAHLREKAAGIFYTERHDPGAAHHVVHKNLTVLSGLGLESTPPVFPLNIPVSTIAREIRERIGDPFTGLALVNPGGGWPNKRWPPARFGDVARHLRACHGLATLVLWGPGEQDLASAVVAASDGAAIAAPQTGLGDLVALMHQAALFVGGDTGPMQLAAAVGTPTVAIFGPTDPSRNGPWHPADETISRYNTCECHYRRECRRANWCLEEIAVDDVVEAIDRRLARR